MKAEVIFPIKINTVTDVLNDVWAGPRTRNTSNLFFRHHLILAVPSVPNVPSKNIYSCACRRVCACANSGEISRNTRNTEYIFDFTYEIQAFTENSRREHQEQP